MLNLIPEKYNRRLTLHLKRARQYAIRRHWAGIKEKDFSLISSNCIGSRIYEELHIPYRMPTVGLFFFARDYVRFAENLPYYLGITPVFTNTSKYESANETRMNRWYPVGEIDDIEVHFLHYHSNQEAYEKWERRKQRVNWERLFFIFTDQGNCTYEDLERFDRLPHPNKVSFVAGSYPELKSCVTIPAFAGKTEIGNLYTNYELFLGAFNFTRWINQGVKSPQVIVRA